MIPFLIYLFESGMCLALLFLVYFLFLRKETYFTFNRIYLISILVLSLLLPLLHLNFTFPRSKSLEQGIEERNRIKSYYENLIALTDPEYTKSFTLPFREEPPVNFIESGESPYLNNQQDAVKTIANNATIKNKTGFWVEINWARLLLILYLFGMLFFTVRLLLLFRWLRQTIKKYGSTSKSGVNLVQMDEEVPPFSFFRFVFLNRETASHSGFNQILSHEKVHISQRHSYDLLLAHAITIIQWFNPFAWLINKAMKTNHEYIADRNVVEQGYELFDYQSLLLKQIISIRSVELVNNFNLINIKKRIAMMTKIKSGLAAQLKALVVIPAAIFLFFFFAEVTFAQEEVTLTFKDETKQIEGFWQRVGDEGYGQFVSLKDNKMAILEDDGTYKEMEYFGVEHFQTKNTTIFVRPYESINGKLSEIKFMNVKTGNPGFVPVVSYILRGNELIIDWNRTKITRFKKVKARNTIELRTNKLDNNFVSVSTDYYRISDDPANTYFIFMNSKGKIKIEQDRSDFVVETQNVDLADFPAQIKKAKNLGDPFDAPDKIPILVIDAKCEMGYVNAMYHKLREMDELRHILSVTPKDEKVPEVFYHNVGIPRLLPPKDAKLMEEKKVEASGMKIIRIDVNKGVTPTEAASIFEKEIQKDKKFVVLFKYNNETTYKDYMAILDAFYLNIFTKRDKLAKEKYDLPYNDLAKAHQKEIRKSYPMVITERNVDME
jgi:beta-lactamase regulating signal transducer with metallopeptidase domain